MCFWAGFHQSTTQTSRHLQPMEQMCTQTGLQCIFSSERVKGCHPCSQAGIKQLTHELGQPPLPLANQVSIAYHPKLQPKPNQLGHPTLQKSIFITCTLLCNMVINMQSFSFSFSSRWHRSAQKGPYSLHPMC